jgi:hypothetical protein
MRPLVKICGLTRRQDAEEAARLGADHIGVIFYRKSPRCVNEAALPDLLAAIPKGRAVMVDVAPQPGTIALRKALGFACFQIHFDVTGTLPSALEGWAREAGQGALWLAPRLKPEDPLPSTCWSWRHPRHGHLPPERVRRHGRDGEWERFNACDGTSRDGGPTCALPSRGVSAENVLTPCGNGRGPCGFSTAAWRRLRIKSAAKMAAALAAVRKTQRGNDRLRNRPDLENLRKVRQRLRAARGLRAFYWTT